MADAVGQKVDRKKSPQVRREREKRNSWQDVRLLVSPRLLEISTFSTRFWCKNWPENCIFFAEERNSRVYTNFNLRIRFLFSKQSKVMMQWVGRGNRKKQFKPSLPCSMWQHGGSEKWMETKRRLRENFLCVHVGMVGKSDNRNERYCGFGHVKPCMRLEGTSQKNVIRCVTVYPSGIKIKIE